MHQCLSFDKSSFAGVDMLMKAVGKDRTSYLVSFFKTFLDSMVSSCLAWFLKKFLKFLIILIYANYFEQSVTLRNSNFVCVL